MNDRGSYGCRAASVACGARGHYGATAVGLKIYHSVGDRAEAVKQMALDWTALYQNLAMQLGKFVIDPKAPGGSRFPTQAEIDALRVTSAQVQWWSVVAEPRFQAWVKFRNAQLGLDKTVAPDYQAWVERFQTNWEVYEGWKKKLDELRADAQKHGFTITVPSVTPLPTTVWSDVASTVERGAGAVASGAGDVWKVLKYGVWGALGIGAVVALSSVAQNLRSGSDPAEKYMELIRGRRAPELPPSRSGPEPSVLIPPSRPPRTLRPLRRPVLALPPGAPEGE